MAREIIVRLIPSGRPNIEDVAMATGISARSLQRRLHAAGLSHKELVKKAQFEMASRYLINTRLSISQIASKVGYSDAAHFTRAFHQWTGLTPREYRLSRTKH